VAELAAGRGQEPVKVVLERRVKPGAEQHFESWVRKLTQAANQSHALEGSSVLTAGNGEYFILLRFSSAAELDAWHSSPEIVALIAEGEAYASAREPTVRTGLETWFTLPGIPAPATAPPKWKMALVTWLALLPQVIALSFIVPKGLPFPLGPAISTAIPVMMLTWVLMPRLTKLLYRWLYR